MINDLIEYGKWLSNNNLDDFGKDTKDEDYIFVVSYTDGSFSLDNLYLRKEVREHFQYFENLNLFGVVKIQRSSKFFA